jgi:hypothetical protein
VPQKNESSDSGIEKVIYNRFAKDRRNKSDVPAKMKSSPAWPHCHPVVGSDEG